jgi:hypothetical protein
MSLSRIEWDFSANPVDDEEVRQCIRGGLLGKASNVHGLPPSFSLIFCAWLRARFRVDVVATAGEV